MEGVTINTSYSKTPLTKEAFIMSKQCFDKCPHCGSDAGIYIKIDYLRVHAAYKFDGTPLRELGCIAESAEERREGKIAYCLDCDKVIFRKSTIKRQWQEGAM